MTGLNEKEHELERTNHFIKAGYDCLIIWDYEVKDKNKLVNKLKKFNRRI